MTGGFGAYIVKRKNGATFRDVKEQRFGDTRFYTRDLGISMHKWAIEQQDARIKISRKK
jgi:hypothetical protein